MKTVALIEKGKDGTFGIYTPDIQSAIIGEGPSVEDAKRDFENSVKEIIKFYEEAGENLPEELVEIEFEYKYDISSLFNYFDWINVSRFAKRIGINSSLLRQYKSGAAPYISDVQAQKIEVALHKFGKELLAVSL